MNQNKPIRYLRDPQVFDRTKLSKSTRWRLEKAGKFPNRRRLSANSVGWIESEIDAWLSSRELIGGAHGNS